MLCGFCGKGEYRGQDAQAGECSYCGDGATSAYARARRAFNDYAAMDAPSLPAHPLCNLQVRLHRWHVRNFDTNNLHGKALGIAEEIGVSEALLGLMACSGRISHAVLKNGEGIRGMGDETAMRQRIADAIADAQIFAIQMCTLLRLDYGTLLHETAETVMKREWK